MWPAACTALPLELNVPHETSTRAQHEATHTMVMKLRAKTATTLTLILGSPATPQGNHHADPPPRSVSWECSPESCSSTTTLETGTQAPTVLAPAPSSPLNVSPAAVTSPLLRDGSSHNWCRDHFPLSVKPRNDSRAGHPMPWAAVPELREASALEGPFQLRTRSLISAPVSSECVVSYTFV